MPVASCQLLVASKYGSRRPPVFTGNWQLATRNYSSGFTLVEMLTVLAIIVLVLASAVPVFNSLTGNHSLAAAQNQIASLLQTARQDAIYNRQTMGIFFYIDPATDAVAMAEVQLDQQQGGGTTYSPSEIYVSPTNTQSTAPPQGQVNAIEMANYWDPSLTAPGQVGTGEFVYYRDVVTLPANVGIALYNNSVPYPANGDIHAPHHRPLRPHRRDFLRFHGGPGLHPLCRPANANYAIRHLSEPSRNPARPPRRRRSQRLKCNGRSRQRHQ